jgi:hypothetical protein
MSLNQLMPIQINRPGFSNAEIIRDAKKIVEYAIKRKWCSEPQPMTLTTKAEAQRVQRAWLAENR